MIRRGTIGILLMAFLFLPSSIYSALLVPMLIYHSKKISISALRMVAPLFLMMFFGIMFADLGATRDILKDVWYVGKVMIVAMVGILIGYSTAVGYPWLRTTILWCSLAAVFQLLQYLLALSPTEQINASLGAALLLPFFISTFLDGRSRQSWSSWIYVMPILVVIGLGISASRTTLVVLLLALIGARGIFQTRSKTVFMSFALVSLAFFAFPLLPQYDIGNITFLGKMQNSINELLFVKSNDIIEINANWRGFEAYKAYQMWASASLGEKLFGLGLGTPIDIGFYFDLGTEYSVRYLPVLHNAYFSVLVKFGLLGIGLFIVFITIPFRLSKIENDPISVFAANLGKTSAVILMFTTLVVSGPLNISIVDSVTLIWGLSIGLQIQRHRIHRPMRKYNLIETLNASRSIG